MKRTGLLEAFNSALKESDVSEVEMQWSMKVDEARFKELREGLAVPTMEEENTMLWFVMKQRGKIPSILKATGPDGKNYQIKVDQIDPLI